MKYDSNIWGAHYWFVLHTIAHTYPEYPNEITKKKYYEFIHNFPLFIPDAEMGNKFADLINMYSVSPYLNSREGFVDWVNFIHNKINISLGKKTYNKYESTEAFRDLYKPKPVHLHKMIQIRKDYLYSLFFMIFVVLIFLFSHSFEHMTIHKFA